MYCILDIDECFENTDSCDKNAVCTNMPGGYNCTCKPGFIDIDSPQNGTNCTGNNKLIKPLNYPGSYMWIIVPYSSEHMTCKWERSYLKGCIVNQDRRNIQEEGLYVEWLT